MSRPVHVILKGQAKLEFEGLERIASEQQTQGIQNSPEQQLLKSIRHCQDALKSNQTYGEGVPKDQIPVGITLTFAQDSISFLYFEMKSIKRR